MLDVQEPTKAVIVPPAPTLPADPAPLLRQEKPASRRVHPLIYVGGGLLALQLLAPYDLKPAVIVGDISAMIGAQTMEAINTKEIALARQKYIAEEEARIAAHEADVRGKCAMSAILGPEAVKLCNRAADTYFNNARAQLSARLPQ